MPCDSDFSHIEQVCRRQEKVLLPSDYVRIVRNCQENPAPFQVVFVNHSFTDDLGPDDLDSPVIKVGDYKNVILPNLMKKVPGCREFRGLKFSKDGVFSRKSMTGVCSAPVTLFQFDGGLEGAAETIKHSLSDAYKGYIPLKPKKYQDIKFLLQRVFLPENVTYFDTLSSAENVTSESDVENED